MREIIVMWVVMMARASSILALVTRFTKTQWSKQREIFEPNFSDDELRKTGWIVLRSITVDAILLGLTRHANVIHFEQSNVFNVCSTWFAMFVCFELWFYFSHRVLHHRWLRKIHAQHHKARVTHPMHSMSFSIAERVVLISGAVIPAIVLSRVMSFSLLGFGIYFAMNFVWNALGHANVEVFSARFRQSVWSKIFISPTFHAMHHHSPRGNYALSIRLLDQWFKTEIR